MKTAAVESADEAVFAACSTIAELGALRTKLATIDEQRQRLEAELSGEHRDASEAVLNDLLARLHELEHTRRQCLAAIEARGSAAAGYEDALARKVELLRAAERPIVHEIDALGARMNALDSYLAQLDVGLARAEDALQRMQKLDERLGEASAWSTADLSVPFPLDVPLGLAKHVVMQSAREHQEAVVRALRALEQALDGLLIEGRPILDLRQAGLERTDLPRWFNAFADGFFDFSVAIGLGRWRQRAKQAREALEELQGELCASQGRVGRARGELGAQRAQLIANA